MAITLLVLFLLSIALALVGLSISIRLRMVKGETDAVVRGALADSALDEAVAFLAADEDFTGRSPHALNGGKIQSRVVDMGSRRYTVTAAGTYAGKVRAIEATVFRSSWGGVTIESWRLADPNPDGDDDGEDDGDGEATPP